MPGGLHPPPSVIASWPKPNYVDPVTRGDALTIVAILFPTIGIFLVSARIYSRVFITKAPGLDDLLVVLASIFGIGLAVLVIIGDKVFYTDRHIWDIPESKFSGSRLNVWCSEWCYVSASCSVKISILLFYRRLSVTFSKTFLWATWAGIIYNIGYMIAFLFNLVFQCQPINSYWLAFDPAWLEAGNTYTCHSSEHLSLPLSGVFSVIGDFYSTVLPLCLVYFLDLPRRQKMALYGLFALGFLVVAAGIARTILLNRVINETYDFSWTLWEMWIWTIVELYVAIFAASAPALKPFLRKFFIEPISMMSSGNGYSRGFGFDGSKGKSGDRHQNERGPKSSGDARAAMWSQDGTTVQDSHADQEYDIEKVGVAVSREKGKFDVSEMEMEDYRHPNRQLPDHDEIGIALPGQHLRAQQSIDLQSDLGRSPSQSHSMAGRGSEDWILPEHKFDDSCALREYRAAIETLPPLPAHPQSHRISRSASLDKQQRHGKRPSTEMSGSTVVGGLNQPGLQYSSQRKQSADKDLRSPLERHPSQGSVKAKQARAWSAQIAQAKYQSPDNGIDYSLPTPTFVPAQSRPDARFEGPRTGSRLDLDSDSDEDMVNGRGVERAVPSANTSVSSNDRRTWNMNTLRDRSEEASLDDHFAALGQRVDSSEETLRLPRQGSRDDFYAGSRVGMAM